MQIDRDALSRHYASLSDEELLALDRDDLTDTAQEIYDREMEERQLDAAAEEEPRNEAISPVATGDADPDWIDKASCACSFQTRAAPDFAGGAEWACQILQTAGIPCHVVPDHTESGAEVLNVMVPGPLNLKASSVLDRDLFNQELEETWKAHFAELSDDELRALDPDVLCAGILDRAARLQRIYQEEKERRSQAASA